VLYQPLWKLAQPQDFWFFRERKHPCEFETGLPGARTGEGETEKVHASLDVDDRSITSLEEEEKTEEENNKSAE